MVTTPIRNLVLMLDTITDRQHALDGLQEQDDLSDAEWAPASRVWSRQAEALSCAIIAEPPQTFDDVLAVMVEVAVRRDLMLGQDDPTECEQRDLREMTDVAIKNCTIRLAALFRPDEEPTETQQQSLAWVSKQVAQWAPKPEGR